MPNANKLTTAISGEYNAYCDRCGHKVKASTLVRDGQYPGLMVCERHYDPRHPQDFTRIVEKTDAPAWTQPPAPDKFGGLDIDGNSLNPDTSAYAGTVSTGTFPAGSGVVTKA
jgi:hypothetical protein